MIFVTTQTCWTSPQDDHTKSITATSVQDNKNNKKCEIIEYGIIWRQSSLLSQAWFFLLTNIRIDTLICSLLLFAGKLSLGSWRWFGLFSPLDHFQSSVRIWDHFLDGALAGGSMCTCVDMLVIRFCRYALGCGLIKKCLSQVSACVGCCELVLNPTTNKFCPSLPLHRPATEKNKINE